MEELKSYILGYFLSLALTVAAFLAVIYHLLTGWPLVLVIIGFALIQLWVQLIFFLHLDREKGTKWNLAVFLSTMAIVFVLVGGSLWIMHNLNYHMTGTAADDFLIKDEGIQK